MKHFNVFVATLVLTCFAFLPTTARADELDDLDVTMEVMDDVAGMDVAISQMAGPEGDNLDGGGGNINDNPDEEDEPGREGSDDGEFGEDEFGEAEDDFEHDEDFDESDLDEEDDFEEDEGEEVDDDEFDEDEDDDEDDDDMDDDLSEESDDDVSDDRV